MITLRNVSKKYKVSGRIIKAVDNVNLKIEKGILFGIIGYSGAGKSTLVRCINLLEKPDKGQVFLGDKELTALDRKGLCEQRKKIGMIFQQFNLLSQKSVLKNVSYPLEINNWKKSDIRKKVTELLKLVGLEDKINSFPSQLSGGQKQRVAIARALATDPQVLLCDEATSALDPSTTNSILELLEKINKELGVTIVIITHEMKVVQKICDEVAVMENGKIVEKGKVSDVFINPQSDLAKKLIIPQSSGEISDENCKTLRIVFEGQNAKEPVISNLVLRCNVAVNIEGAKTQNIGGKAYGQMILKVPDDDTSVRSYLDSIGIKYEEVDIHGA